NRKSPPRIGETFSKVASPFRTSHLPVGFIHLICSCPSSDTRFGQRARRGRAGFINSTPTQKVG
ncbi:MAG: hypothetical protein KGL75_00540, partial [Acidobacteriota bacterium]|nr:hypothetical protein [Acidobacteriota bacterium]